jgi:hypothetical protein
MFYKEDSNGLCLFAQLLLVIFSHTASPSCPTLHVFLSRRITLGPSPSPLYPRSLHSCEHIPASHWHQEAWPPLVYAVLHVEDGYLSRALAPEQRLSALATSEEPHGAYK